MPTKCFPIALGIIEILLIEIRAKLCFTVMLNGFSNINYYTLFLKHEETFCFRHDAFYVFLKLFLTSENLI